MRFCLWDHFFFVFVFIVFDSKIITKLRIHCLHRFTHDVYLSIWNWKLVGCAPYGAWCSAPCYCSVRVRAWSLSGLLYIYSRIYIIYLWIITEDASNWMGQISDFEEWVFERLKNSPNECFFLFSSCLFRIFYLFCTMVFIVWLPMVAGLTDVAAN